MTAMGNRVTQKEKLDTIGRRLIASSALFETEIDKIAGDGDLFTGVLRRIESENKASRPSPSRLLNRYRVAVGSMAAFVFVASLGLYALSIQTGNSVSLDQAGPAAKPDAQRAANSPQPIVSGFAAGRAIDAETEFRSPQPIAQTAVYRQERQSVPSVQRASTRAVPDAEFFPVTYTDDSGESARGGRVIRVDVPRSTLFAMGMNVPLENESPTVKAELLIGPDGVTRAFRIVE